MPRLQPLPTYRLKAKKQKQPIKPHVDRLGPTSKGDEGLTGIINGWEASDLEERFARALSKNSRVDGFTFRDHYFGPTRTTPGAIEIDFMVSSRGLYFPVQIDGEYAHRTQPQRDVDAQKDQILNKYFSRFGNIANVQRIPDATRMHAGILDSQDSADNLVQKLF